VREGVVKKTEESIQTATVVTEPGAQGPSAAEERVLRMRAGVTVGANERLGNKLDGVREDARTEAAARLALIEAELLADQAAAEDDSPKAERFRRIVAALKEKGEG
jgi:hypothetical protein